MTSCWLNWLTTISNAHGRATRPRPLTTAGVRRTRRWLASVTKAAADLYDRALHALEEIDDELPDRDDQAAGLLIARCEALLAAGDVTTAAGAVSQLQRATVGSARLAAWATCFDGELSMLVHPERLDEIEAALGAAAAKLAELDDAAGEAKAHTVRAACLARLGRVGDCEIALDDALTAARRAGEHRRVNAVLAGAPLAALWGPNPVPRAGGRCLDVVRLLRITTDSPAVEATSTRCQAVLEAFRGRAEAARRMIDSARRTVTELGLRHALLEVEQFAGIVELVVDDPAAAEPHLRQAYNGFRRMGLDADTADTAALLGRACLALDQEAEADELCTESERLAGNALKPAMAWRMLRAQLLSRRGDHGEARRQAEAAVALAERTDALVDHGDACLALATVLGAAGDVVGSRAAAERAVDLYERKGAAALAEKARGILGEHVAAPVAPPEAPGVELDNACVRAVNEVITVIHRRDLEGFAQLYSPNAFVESRRKIVGFNRINADEWIRINRHNLKTGDMRFRQVAIAVQGERLALFRVKVDSADESPGAPYDEFLSLFGIDEDGRIALQVWFDVEDIDAAITELDATHARFEEEAHRLDRRLANAGSQLGRRFLARLAAGDWDAMAGMVAGNFSMEDRRRLLRSGVVDGRDGALAATRAIHELFGANVTPTEIATRGSNLFIGRLSFSGSNEGPEPFLSEMLTVNEINDEDQLAAIIVFDPDDFDAAIAELDARYLAGEAARYAHTWSAIAAGHAAVNRRELPPIAADAVSIDHRRGTAFAPGELIDYFRAGWDADQSIRTYVEKVHRLSDLGAVCTHVGHGNSHEGFNAEWRGVDLLTVDGDRFNRCEVFDEADLDVALAKFDQLSRPAPRLENAASQAAERLWSCFAAQEWAGLTETLADDVVTVDRRRVVNGGVIRGRDHQTASLRASFEAGVEAFTSAVIATRGRRVALTSLHATFRGLEGADVLGVVEVDADNRIASGVLFDPDDFEAAISELDARYLAGEAAVHPRMWSAVVGAYAAINRHEIPTTTPDFEDKDHRRGAAFAPGDMIEYLRAGWDLDQEIQFYVETVHRLTDLGAVVSHNGRGTSRDGFDAEWREVMLLTGDGESFDRCEVFDEADLDTALARFEELNPHTRRLENAASQAAHCLRAFFVARDWEGLAELFAEDIVADDRRRIVGTGIRRGRQANVADIRAGADVGTENITSTAIATRGARIFLDRARFSASDRQLEALGSELLRIVEVGSDNRMTCCLMFDVDDFDSAITELDARYLTGEAAAHAHVWSVVTGAYAAFNRHERPPTTPDWVNIDHRRVTAFPSGALPAYMHATWELTPNANMYIETVHRLTSLGLIVTRVVRGTSREGFDAEWREIGLSTVKGDRINRSELFDEADIDAAIAKLDELSRPTSRLENAASRVAARFREHFAAGDWAAVAAAFADDFSSDDRRRVVGAGVRHGRDAEMADLRSIASVGITQVTSTPVATRGERLVLTRGRLTSRDQGAEAYFTESLAVVEIDTNERIVALVNFDLEDIDAAIAELDARYLVGEAAAHAQTWSVVTRAYAAANEHELPPTTPDLVNIDHRRLGMIEAGGLIAYLRDTFDDLTDMSTYVEAVHRLSDVGAVITHVGKGSSRDGFDAEWRLINVATRDGDLISRAETFAETDLDAAIARFEELSRPALKNAASQAYERICEYLAARDWHAVAELCTEKVTVDDRRRLVNAGIRTGRDATMKDVQVAAEIGFTYKLLNVIATRGERLALVSVRAAGRDPETIANDAANIVEIDSGGQIVADIIFDMEDIDAAFAELDARYLAGEAAAHAHTWTLVTRAYDALTRRQLPGTTVDWVNIDHRRLAPIAAGDLGAYLRATWDLSPQSSIHIEAVHRLSEIGAVVTHVIEGTSQQGFDAEWRTIDLSTYEGDLISRCELFDEADLDAALARFDELQPQSRQLKNAASVVVERFWSCFATRDWVAMAETMADEFRTHDRRRVVNAGVLRGRAVHITNMRAMADVGFERLTSTVLATRGHRLALIHIHASLRDAPPAEVIGDVLSVIHIDVDNRLVSNVVFDATDIDAAFEELDAGFLAGEAAVHSRTWMAITQVQAAYNRHEIPPTTEDLANVDHRRGRAFAPGDSIPFIVATWNVIPDVKGRIEAVHRLTNFGAVVTEVMTGSSRDGFDAEWREIGLFAFDGDLICRFELFDETDLDAALARFDESHPRSPRLENAASQAVERYWSYFAARNWDALAETMADAVCTHDRRRVVNAGVVTGRAAHIANMRAVADVGFEGLKSTVIATRGHRLVLIRIRSSVQDSPPGEVTAEMLSVIGVDADNKIDAAVMFDSDDLDAAFEELDARYLAGEAAEHEHMWSVIAAGYASLNRHELPASASDCISIDHRPLVAIEARDMAENIRDLWRLTPDHRIYVEAVHRLNNVGAVVTHVASGTSDQGFDAEWRVIEIFVFGGDLISRVEMFDEADLAAALARFDELDRPAS